MVSRKEMTASSNNVFYLYLLFLKSSPLFILTASVREAWDEQMNKKNRMMK